MKILLLCVVTVLLLQECMAICKGNWHTCNRDDNCCNGYACKYWSLDERRCRPHNNNYCKAFNEECSMFEWCCDGLTCEEKDSGEGRKCRRD